MRSHQQRPRRSATNSSSRFFSRSCTTSTPPEIAGCREVAEVATAGHAVAHQVEPRGRKACAALLAGGVGHGPQVGHRTQSDTCGRSSIRAMNEGNTSAVDLAILGGGIVGLSVAWRAQKEGMSVAVLERDTLGAGASRVAAGMLAPVAEVEFGEAGRRVLEQGMRSASLWPAFAAELERDSGIDVGLRRTGTLVVARDDDEARELERQLAFRESLGLRAIRLRASTAREREPALAPTVRLALEAPEDHCVDPRCVVAALGRACEQVGVQLREHDAVIAHGPVGPAATLACDRRVTGEASVGTETSRPERGVLPAPGVARSLGCPRRQASTCAR